MSKWWDGLNLGVKYAIGLGILVSLVFTYGVFRLWLQKRRVKQINKALQAKALDEEGRMEQVRLNQQEEEEGDLFGIQAIERGFYGGVAQSRPTTPSIASGSTVTLNRIPYGKDSSRSTTIALDLDARKNSEGNKLSQATAVDMSLEVPDSPKTYPMHPDIPSPPSTASSPHVHGSKPSGSSTSSLDLRDDVHDRFTAPQQSISSIVDVYGTNKLQSGPISKPAMVARPPSPGLSLQKYLDPPSITLGESAHPVVMTGQKGPYSSTNGPIGITRTNDTMDEIPKSELEKDLNTPTPRGVVRSSAASFGDFYDYYYDPRKSVARLPARNEGGRAQDAPQLPGINESTNENRYSRGPSRALM